MTPEWMDVVLSALGAGGGAWLAIRVQLQWHRTDITRAQSTADKAHERLDRLNERGHA
jgi:hypothetical protein